MTEVQGGKFRHGFYAGFASSALGSRVSGIGRGKSWGTTARVAAAAVVGGTASTLGGGKFANGAMSGAFVRLFNDEQIHSQLKRSRVVVLGEKSLSDHPSRRLIHGNKESLSNISFQERWESAIFEIGESVSYRTYSSPEELYSLIEFYSDRDKIIITSHGGEGYFDAGGATTDPKNRLFEVDFTSKLSADVASKIVFHHCGPNLGLVDWSSGINILRAIYGLPRKTSYPIEKDEFTEWRLK